MKAYLVVFRTRGKARRRKMELRLETVAESFLKLRKGCYLVAFRDSCPLEDCYELLLLKVMKGELLVIFDISDSGMAGTAEPEVMEWIKNTILERGKGN